MQRQKLKHQLKRKLPDKERIRSANNKWNRLAVAGLIMLSTAIPLLTMIQDVKAYQLTPETLAVIGKANPNLSAKFSFNPETGAWEFNKDGAALAAASQKQVTAAALAQLQAQIGGSGKHDTSLYSASLSADPTKGITYYDNNTQLSFSMVPNFSMRAGKYSQGRVVYPFADGGQLVYTAKSNGLKEDIVLSHNIGDWLRFSYKLNLPSTLEARLEGDGSLGIYSADPALFGNITFGSDVDQAKVLDARQNAPKNNLVFVIPAPIIKDQSGRISTATYALDNNQLIVTASGLSRLHYPLSVDPSVVVTSTSDFATGNGEDNISYSTSNQIGRADVTGGTVTGGWTGTTALNQGRFGQGTTIYNGYLYQVSGSGASGSIEYAQLNSNGTISSWTNVTGTLSQDIYYGGVFAYNGYLYIVGGYGATSGTALSSVLYAKLNTNGSFGSWTTSGNTMATAVCRAGTAVYGGYVYVTGGTSSPGSSCDNTSTGLLNTTQYAQIKANGDIGSWSTSSSTFTNARMSHATVAYNGYLYVVAGTTNGTTRYNTTQYAKILSSGDISSWTTSSNNLPSTIYNVGATVYNGYLYIAGGSTTTSQTAVRVTQLNANGSIDTWQTTSALPTANFASGLAAYNGYLYDAGGSGTTTNVNYAKIDPAGIPTNYTVGTLITGTPVTGASSFVFANRIFVLGGYNGTTYTNVVQTAPLNSDGTVGTWATTTSMSSAAGGFGFAFYNGYIYCVGGFQPGGGGQTTVQYAQVNTNGSLTWNTTTAFPSSVSQHSAAAYNGYLFAMGSGGSGNTTTVQAAPINSNGTIGSWTAQTQHISTARTQESMVTYNGYMYIVAGEDAPTGNTYSSIEYAALNTTSPGSAATVVGSFSTTTSLTYGHDNNFGIGISGGYMYVAGGENNGVDSNVLEFAKINSNGTLGSWSTTTMTNTQKGTSMSISGDVMYLVSGNIGGSRDRHTEIMYINNGGSGMPNTKTTLNSLSDAVGFHDTVAYNGYLYVLGGIDSTAQVNTVQYAQINNDGTLGTWSTTTNMPNALSGLRAVAYNGYMYISGGQSNGSTYYNNVYSIPINSNGTLGASWTATSSFINARVQHGMVVNNGYMYIMGGTDSSTDYNDVQYAQVTGPGTLGAWHYTHNSTDDSTSFVSGFTTARGAGFVAVVNNGYLYIGGGQNRSNVDYGDFQYAPLNSNGTIGTWKYTTSFPGTIYNTNATAYNGSLCVYGGNRVLGNSNTAGSEVFCAQFGVGGTLEAWQQASVTAGPASSPFVKFARSAMYNGNLYFTGGGTGSSPITYTNAVYVLGMDSTSRAAHYSTLVDLGTASTLSAVYFNASSAYYTALQYRYADSTGALGSLTNGINGTGSDPGNTCTPGTTQYVWVFVTLDDSQNYSYPASTGTNVTDITFYYGTSARPTPPQRLHGGKFFSGEALQPLDTCG